MEKHNFVLFLNNLLDKQHFMIYYNDKDVIYSFSGYVDELTQNYIKISNICWQEEGDNYHHICQTKYNDNYLMFDLQNNKIIKDCYLYDKYDDGLHGFLWASKWHLECLFTNMPL